MTANASVRVRLWPMKPVMSRVTQGNSRAHRSPRELQLKYFGPRIGNFLHFESGFLVKNLSRAPGLIVPGRHMFAER